MELVYLWVEDYKNIKNQGFNFSPRFECSYDEKNQELTIDEKENCLENFFGENINVTAIVGENGSGKSSVFEILTFLYWQGLVYSNKDKTFFLFLDGNKFFIQCENMKLSIPPLEKKLSEFIRFKNNTNIEVSQEFSPRGDMPLIGFFNCISDITNNHNLEGLKSYANYYNGIQPSLPMMKSKKNYHNFNLKFQYILKENSNLFNFIDVNLVFNNYQVELHISELEASIVQFRNEKLKELLSFQNTTTDDKKELLYQLFIVLAISITSKKLIEKYLENDSYIKNLLEDDIVNILNNETFTEDMFNSIIEKCNEKLATFKDKLQEDIFNKKSVKFILDSYTMGDIPKDKSYTIFKSNILSIENNELNSIYSEPLLNFLFEYQILQLNFFNLNNSEYSFLNLSSGEKLYLNFLTNYIYTLCKLPNGYKGIFLFDEIELSFHPFWQKQIINHLVLIHKKISKNKKIDIHILITSHSPFILSDLPKENVIFLERYTKKEIEKKKLEQKIGNCKNATTDIDINPFGANIHTLLSDGFFMQDGLMGEFAKGKINQIKIFYEEVKEFENNKDELEAYKCVYDDKKKEFWQIQNIIGEPFLKTIIGNYLDEIEKILFEDKAKEEEIKRVVSKLGKKDLQKYLESLKDD
ncbi:MAG: AAA family ATPase [Campylobacterota bacterium]|nr:AAA family ATPase [Campylobacterota bacterium]